MAAATTAFPHISPCNIPVPGIPTGSLCHAAGSATKAIAGSAFQSVVDGFAKGLASIMKALMTFWIHTPEPDVSNGSAVIQSLGQATRPLIAFAAVAGLIIAGARLVWTAHHTQSIQSILRGLLLVTLVTAGGATVIALALTAFDDLAVAILNNGFDAQAVSDRLGNLGQLPGAGGGLILILAFFGMIASLVQFGVMIVRGAILAVLVGILPVAAAASIGDTGFTWFKRLLGWILSFTLYKLAAAIVYAAAFTMIGTGNDLAGVISGFALILVAILALPALLRLLPPASEAMASGMGGGMAAAVGAGATGAIALAGRGGGSSASTASATPGLKADSGPSGASGVSDSSGGADQAGRSQPASTSSGAVSSGAGSGAGGAGAAGGAAAGGSAAGGPVGAGVAAAGKAYGAAKSGAQGAVGGSDGGSS